MTHDLSSEWAQKPEPVNAPQSERLYAFECRRRIPQVSDTLAQEEIVELPAELALSHLAMRG